MRPRVRRALRRLLWVLVHGGARALAMVGGWLIQRAVAVELAAERRVDLSRPVRVDGWTPLPESPRATAEPAYHPSRREDSLACFSGTHGKGLYVLNDQLSAVIANAGRC